MLISAAIFSTAPLENQNVELKCFSETNNLESLE